MRVFSILPFLLLFIFFSTAFTWDIKTRIAVLDVVSKIEGEDINGVLIGEKIRAEMVNQKAGIIVERAALSKILEEQKLQDSGIAEGDAGKIGNLVGAEKIVMGNIFKVSGKYELLIKAIDVDSGKIEFYEQIRAGNIGEIYEKIPEMVSSIIRKSKGEMWKQERVNTEFVEKFLNSEDGFTNRGFSPVQISFVGGIQLIPEDFTIFGVAVNIITGYNVEIYGIQTGLICENSEMRGIQAGLICSSKSRIVGVQTGLINNAYYVTGCQIGLINTAEFLKGVQIGLLNTVKHGPINFMPIINIGF